MERPLGPELRRMSNLCSRYFEQTANRQLVDSLTGTNSWIICYVARRTEKGETVYQRDLERHFGVTRSTASKVVNLMVQKGLIEQCGVAGDKRLRQLLLTGRAWELKRLMDEDRDYFEGMLRQGFSEEEMATLFSLIDRLQDNLSRISGKEGRDKT